MDWESRLVDWTPEKSPFSSRANMHPTPCSSPPSSVASYHAQFGSG
ncbi:hypothetical protein FOMG_19564 [Fusarium oxysporum f. sp. melonis 26406]|uniref:Uncharacterized protein n=1 Tax=Fusarium oxysporum f. sp. melonis 26406 TaxID=1089452 RepID=W9YWY5_FUSOX|nr:hypothetical protein FOMG_19564 [Fusarium oxysporum f. sp. melonis 26406]